MIYTFFAGIWTTDTLKNYSLSNIIKLLPLQKGTGALQVPFPVQVIVEKPSVSMVYPGWHAKVTFCPIVKSSPYLTPLAGTPGSPQLITAAVMTRSVSQTF